MELGLGLGSRLGLVRRLGLASSTLSPLLVASWSPPLSLVVFRRGRSECCGLLHPKVLEADFDPMLLQQLHTEVRGGSIMVSLPGTSYSVTYCMSLKGRRLCARSLPTRHDRDAAMTTEEFLTEAWQLARLRARELGWLV
jgi:hypothetical protein